VDPKDVEIPPDPPRADFEAAPREATVGQEVTFFARRSPGAIDQLAWSFGDGATLAGSLDTHDAVKHTYTKSGTMTISLVATGIGGRDEATKIGYVVVKDAVRPKAGFSWAPENPRVGQVVTLINKSTGEPETYRWQMGAMGESAEAAPKITPTAAGDLAVELTVQRGTFTDTVKAVIKVLPLAPSPAFSLEPSGDVELGQTVRAVAAERGSGVEHQWRFGGESFSGSEVTWTATVTGSVEVVHRVMGPGGKNEARDRVYIRDIGRPDADFDIEPKRVLVGADVVAQAKKDEAGWQHRWTVDGTVYSGVSVKFKVAGTEPVTIIHEVVAKGRTGVLERTVTPVEEAVLIPRFSASTTKGHRELNVQFTDETEGVVTAYAWDFGDGSPVSTDKNPAHTYTAAGTYAVRLSVANKFGQKTAGVEPVEITVTEPPPAWLWPAIIGAVAVLAGLVAFLKMRPKPPGGTIQWEDELGDRSSSVEVTGTRFSLNDLKVPGWQPKGQYVIVRRDGRPVLLRDGEVSEQLGRSTRLRLDNVVFVYLNPLVDD
jgi:PKD repeat protein